MTPEMFNLPLELQTALAGGYLAYWIGYAGLEGNRRAVDIALLTFAFGLPAIGAFRLALPHGALWAVMAGLGIAISGGLLWRIVGRELVLATLKRLGIHREDGVHSAWAALIQQRNLTVGQLSVHTKDGRVLYQNANHYPEAHLGGMYFGGDGSIVMVVEEEDLPNGSEEQRTGIKDANWGTRVTYIPADQIQRVNIR